MENKVTRYLHFAKFDKLNSWEIKFTNSLASILQQLLGQPALFLCNCDIPGTIFCNPEDVTQLLESKAFIFIFNNSSTSELKDSELLLMNSVMDLLLLQQKENICIVNRYFKKKNTFTEKFGRQTTFNFFELNVKTQEIIDFKPDSKEDKDNNYWLKITDLAYTIKSFAEENNSAKTHIHSRKQTIFLAEVSMDQLKTRDRLRRDLQLSGYNVIPSKPLPKDSVEFAKEVKSMLEKAVLSVNIMGELYGENPTGSDYSYQELQNKYFLEVFNNQVKEDISCPIRRIIWSAPLFDPYEEKQIQYIKRLNREINATDHSQLVQSTLFDLVALIEQKIQTLSIDVEEKENKKDTLLLIADNYSDPLTLQIQQELALQQIPYNLLHDIAILSENNLGEIMQTIGKYQHNLILNTKQENLWIDSILTILSRSKGYAQTTPAGKTGLFWLGSQKKYPDFFLLTIEPYLINNVNLSQQLTSFISKIKA